MSSLPIALGLSSEAPATEHGGQVSSIPPIQDLSWVSWDTSVTGSGWPQGQGRQCIVAVGAPGQPPGRLTKGD